ncbi:XRE family transcriptional regulator [Kitasatospora sp. MBT63]|uniref:XRE family transcriptional regulator n=1 Tax=Kitasatospora sp. MBT63 TaxID=1444768 RepID=UPI001E443B20|nr:XRE family transcriptional regulator [Kitasatospora sp. MBT63]
MTAERDARGWSQTDAIGAMRAHSPKKLPEDPTMLRQWKRWESGEVVPSEFYQPLIAATFGTVTHALFPVAGRRDGNAEIVAASGMETLDIISRLQASDVDNATMDALRITTDRLCSEYASLPSGQLAVEGRQWLKRVVGLQGQRLTLAQHREVLAMSGWLALLVGCVEYDMGDKRAAESTRRAALSLGVEAEHAGIQGWANEMRAWFALTTGDYRGVIAASKAGAEVAAHQGVAVQLAAQEAKAWARLGDRRQAEVALDRGRRLLEGMPYPENLDNHFVVDPAKYDFYAMDCYRMLGENRLATTLAEEVIRASTDYDGTERSPMRIAEARLTLGVVAARDGDLDSALNYGEWALRGERQSLPSLLAVSRELAGIVNKQYGNDPGTRAYLHQLSALSGVGQ